MKKRNSKMLNFIFLHFSIFIFTGSTVLSKVASQYKFLSVKYVLCFIGIFLFLGLFALLWQQAIKPFSPSVAYSNKSVTTIWVLIASMVFFNEGITILNIIGAVLIITGVVLVSQKK